MEWRFVGSWLHGQPSYYYQEYPLLYPTEVVWETESRPGLYLPLAFCLASASIPARALLERDLLLEARRLGLRLQVRWIEGVVCNRYDHA